MMGKRFAIGVLATLAFVAATACDSTDGMLGTPDVKFSVTDTTCDRALVTWGASGTNQADVRLPWSDIIEVSDEAVAIVAQRDCDDGGTLTVTLYVDGDRVDRATGRGAFAMASASAWVD